MRSVLNEYIEFYNTRRPHQGIGQQSPIIRLPEKREGVVQERAESPTTTIAWLHEPFSRIDGVIRPYGTSPPLPLRPTGWLAALTTYVVGTHFVRPCVLWLNRPSTETGKRHALIPQERPFAVTPIIRRSHTQDPFLSTHMASQPRFFQGWDR